MHSCVYVYICGCMHTWTSKDNWVGQSLSTFHILSVIDLGLCHVGQALSFHARLGGCDAGIQKQVLTLQQAMSSVQSLVL